MRINKLKFKQLSRAIYKKKLNLDMFSQSNQLFESTNHDYFTKSPRTLNRFDNGQKKSRSKTHEKNMNRSHVRQARQKQNVYKTEDIFYYLEESVLTYLEYLSPQEKRSIKKQMQVLLSILKSQSHKAVLSKLQYLQSSLSKKLTNRLVHLIFHIIYNKLSNGHQDIDKQIKIYILCEYYSRKFNFKCLTLSICAQIQHLYCLINDYENSRVYARKCLKLAVILNNDYYENKMIDGLYLLNYYEGRLNDNNKQKLSKEERFRIIQNYREENQIPDLFGLEKYQQREGDQFKEFELENLNNYTNNHVPNNNIEYFKSNYHDIIKIMPNKTLNLRKVMKKVASVGVVKKYFGKDNFITIKPQCHVIKPRHQGQVLITHKKETVMSSQKTKNMGMLNERIIRLLAYLISSYEYDR